VFYTRNFGPGPAFVEEAFFHAPDVLCSARIKPLVIAPNEIASVWCTLSRDQGGRFWSFKNVHEHHSEFSVTISYADVAGQDRTTTRMDLAWQSEGVFQGYEVTEVTFPHAPTA
jgi:hypothetical protein